jgi:hypothetical protein
MQYLLPIGGQFDKRFAGILTSYKHYGIPAGIKAGIPWAGDNCAFSGFDANEFMNWLPKLAPYRATCLFIVVPDAPGNARKTLDLWDEWAPQLADWPLAFAAQDGMENLDWPATMDITDYAYDNLRLPDDTDDTDDNPDDLEYGWEPMKERYYREETPFRCVFVGGSDAWKESETAAFIIQEALAMQKHIHIGRVNWERRYRHFAHQPGAATFTCDGTRTRAEGRHRTLHAWANYQAQLERYQTELRQLRLNL